MAAGDPGSPARYYSSTAVETALSGSIPAQAQGAANTSFIVASVSGFPSSYPYTLIVDPDTSKEEVVTVTAGSGTTLSVTRGSDSTQGVAHSAGAVVRHGVSGRDFREAETHIAARGYDIDQTILDLANQTHVHGIVTAEGVVVGTLKAQTLTQKTLTTPTINGATISGAVTSSATVTGGTFTSVTVTSSTISTSTLTGSFTASAATFVSPTISGSPVITGLSSAGMVNSSATPKIYVDSILGSATSAAVSAASAAVSATSAATSATSSATSATASASSASASATSASAAATSATSAAASATAAATSASSASTSASSALTSQSAAATSAASASTSASSALTSATSAATSYDEFDDRYLGAKATAPTLDNDGNALLTGALYWNTAVNKMYVWSGTAWGEISSSADIIAYKYTVAGGATSVSGADDNGLTLTYTVGKEQVYINGVLQVRGSDYTATTGSSITGITAMIASDIVTVLAFTAFSVSNTYTIAQADATFIPDAIVDTKGDLIVATAADTVARLAAGNNGEQIVADSSTSTGLRYQAPKVQNGIYNSAFNVWQRGTTSVATANAYTADRWQKGAVTSFTISRQVTGDTTNLPNIQYCGRVQRTASSAVTTVIDIGQTLETLDAVKYAGKTVTISFYARAGANFSAVSNVINANLYTGTGTDQSIMTGLTGSTQALTFNSTLTSTWQRFQGTVTLSSSATEVALYILYNPTGTAGANDYYEITGVQLEVGSVATPYTPMSGSIQGELAACQRYLPAIAAVAGELAAGMCYATTAAIVPINFPVTPRVAPTGITVSSAGAFRLRNSGAAKLTVTSLNFSTATQQSCTIEPVVASGLVAGNATNLFNETAGTILFTGCEL